MASKFRVLFVSGNKKDRTGRSLENIAPISILLNRENSQALCRIFFARGMRLNVYSCESIPSALRSNSVLSVEVSHFSYFSGGQPRSETNKR